MNKTSIPNQTEVFKRLKELIIGQPTDDFNKRQKGLKLWTFLTVFTISIVSMGKVTLEELANKCIAIQRDLIGYTKQALSSRLEAGSKELKKLLAATVTAVTMRNLKPDAPVVLEQFARALITDATTLSLPDKLESVHKGLGGSNANSAIKIQTTYDIKTKDFSNIAIIVDATESDSSYVDKLVEATRPNDLHIMDLGYYGVDGFIKIDEKGAYFISKTKPRSNIYDLEGKKLDLVDLLKSKAEIDKDVKIRSKSGVFMKVRLVGKKLPEEVYSKKIREARKKAKGRTLSAEELTRLKWILIITNVERAKLSIDAICELYRMRWQIELIFKAWKSHFKLDEMNNVGKDYLHCLIYGKLVVITVMTALYSTVFYEVKRLTGRFLSYLRFMKNIRAELNLVVDFISKNLPGWTLVDIIFRVVRSSLNDKRLRKITEQVIDSLDLPKNWKQVG